MTKNNLNQISNSIHDNHINFVLDKINDHCLRMAVMDQKTFPWHTHPNSDELFLILEGKLVIEFENDFPVTLFPGDFYKVVAGKVHRTVAKSRTVNLCFESTIAETVFLKSDELAT